MLTWLTGTGTLLMAASQVITDNFVRQSAARRAKLSQKAFSKLHKAILGASSYGFDVLTSAIPSHHLTLALLAPEIAFKRMHLYSMPMGARATGKSQIHLGSIDFLHTNEWKTQLNLWGKYDSENEVGEITAKGLREIERHHYLNSICV